MEAFLFGFYAALGAICAAAIASVVAFIAAAVVYVKHSMTGSSRGAAMGVTDRIELLLHLLKLQAQRLILGLECRVLLFKLRRAAAKRADVEEVAHQGNHVSKHRRIVRQVRS